MMLTPRAGKFWWGDLFFISFLILMAYWYFTGDAYDENLTYVSIADQPVGDKILVGAVLYRKRACRYIFERQILDITGNRVSQLSEVRPLPNNLGNQSFTAYVKLDSIPEPGPAKYRVRIGTMCNPLRRLFPKWEIDTSVQFNFLHP